MTIASDIIAANKRIKIEPNEVRETPLELSRYFSALTKTSLYLKCEHLQQTGSFKLRGATNKLSQLTSAEKKQGVVTASSGNHALGVALAASLLNIDAIICVPENASPAKIAAIRQFGGNIHTVQGDCLIAEQAAQIIALQQNKVYVSPYNDYQVICGQGTVGLELLAVQPDLDAIFIAVGGGGLIGGIGSFIKAINPEIKIIGCWPQNAPSFYHALEQGKVVHVEEQETLSDGTAGGVEVGTVTLPICQQVIDHKVLVSEQQIAEAIQLAAIHERFMLEGAAGVALAAAIQEAPKHVGNKIAVVLCGRNIALNKFIGVVK